MIEGLYCKGKSRARFSYGLKGQYVGYRFHFQSFREQRVQCASNICSSTNLAFHPTLMKKLHLVKE